MLGRRGWGLINCGLEGSGAEWGEKSVRTGKGGLRQCSVLLHRWPSLPPLTHADFCAEALKLYAEAADESGKQQTKGEVADGCE